MTELILWIEGPHSPINHAKFEKTKDLYEYVDSTAFGEEALIWNLDPSGSWFRNMEPSGDNEFPERLHIDSDCFFACFPEEVPPEIRAHALLLS